MDKLAEVRNLFDAAMDRPPVSERICRGQKLIFRPDKEGLAPINHFPLPFHADRDADDTDEIRALRNGPLDVVLTDQYTQRLQNQRDAEAGASRSVSGPTGFDRDSENSENAASKPRHTSEYCDPALQLPPLIKGHEREAAVLEVVSVIENSSGEPVALCRYLRGWARLNPGGNRSEWEDIPLRHVKEVQGIPTADFLKKHLVELLLTENTLAYFRQAM